VPGGSDHELANITVTTWPGAGRTGANNALGRHFAQAATLSVFNNCGSSIDFSLGGKGYSGEAPTLPIEIQSQLDSVQRP
jgi:hypothetical protein